MKKYGLFLLIAILLCMAPLFGNPSSDRSASQASWPVRPITLIIPWNPGDGTDLAGRAFAQALQNVTGQPVVVVNRPGASGSVGTIYASQQAPDGYTLLFSAETPGTFQIMGLTDVSFSDFEGIMVMAEDTRVLVVSRDSPYRTIQDLLNAMRANPGRIRLAYSGPGASGHIEGLILDALGYNVSMTPFGGGAAGLTAVMGGQVDYTGANTATIMGFVASGDLRPLATFTNRRTDALPGVPAITEVLPESSQFLPLGFPHAVLVPKNTPPDIRAQILAATEKAIEDRAWLDFLDARVSFRPLHEHRGPGVNEFWARWQSIVCWLLYDAGVTQRSPADFGIPRIQR